MTFPGLTGEEIRTAHDRRRGRGCIMRPTSSRTALGKGFKTFISDGRGSQRRLGRRKVEPNITGVQAVVREAAEQGEKGRRRGITSERSGDRSLQAS